MKKQTFISLNLLFILFSFSKSALAIAGGGELDYGIGVLGIIIGIILAPFFLIWAIYVTIRFRVKKYECERLLNRIEQSDASWNSEKLTSRIEKAFFAVQDAWMKRDQEIAREFMSKALYAKHKSETEEMKRNQEKNIMKDIQLHKITLTSAVDYKDNSKDYFKAYIEGAMIDYTINESNKQILSGKLNQPGTFYQLWTFIRENDVWVVDRIQAQVDKIDAVQQSKTFREE